VLPFVYAVSPRLVRRTSHQERAGWNPTELHAERISVQVAGLVFRPNRLADGDALVVLSRAAVAVRFPWSAALRYHLAASSQSLGTPPHRSSGCRATSGPPRAPARRPCGTMSLPRRVFFYPDAFQKAVGVEPLGFRYSLLGQGPPPALPLSVSHLKVGATILPAAYKAFALFNIALSCRWSASLSGPRQAVA